MTPPMPPLPPLPPMPEDAHAALETIREVGGQELVVALLKTFVEYVDAQVADAERAGASADAASIARIAHTVKSSANQVGAHALAHVCAEAERAHGGSDASESAAFVAGISREYAIARRWMQGVIARG